MTGTNLRLGEVGYVARSLARSPAFSGAVVATLSVAIAANVAIFAIVNALVFRPLPYPDVDRLATVASTPQGAVRRMGLSYPDYADYRDRARSLEGLGLAGARSYVMNAGDQAALVS